LNNQLLKCGDVVFVNLPSHNPKGHEQEGKRPAVVVGVPLGDVRYPVVVVVPLTTQFGVWVKKILCCIQLFKLELRGYRRNRWLCAIN